MRKGPQRPRHLEMAVVNLRITVQLLDLARGGWWPERGPSVSGYPQFGMSLRFQDRLEPRGRARSPQPLAQLPMSPSQARPASAHRHSPP